MTVNRLLWVATIISIATFQLYKYLPENSFYIGMAIFIFLLSLIIFMQNRKLFISFFLLCIAFNNLIDELFFDPKKFGINEILFALIIPTFYYARKICKQRILYFFNENYISRFFGRRCKDSNRDDPLFSNAEIVRPLPSPPSFIYPFPVVADFK